MGIFFSAIHPSIRRDQSKTKKRKCVLNQCELIHTHIISNMIPIPNPVIKNSNQDGALYQAGTKLTIKKKKEIRLRRFSSAYNNRLPPLVAVQTKL